MEINVTILQIAAGIAMNGYTPEDKGVYSEMKNRNEKTSYNPENVAKIYKELSELLSLQHL